MKNRVTVNQLALLLLLVLSGGKFLGLPAIIAGEVDHDGWLSMSVCFLCDALCLAFVLWAIKANRYHTDFNSILNKTLGKFASKVIMTVFFVVFILRILVLCDSCYEMFSVTFDVNASWLIFILPIIVVACIAIAVGFRAVARMGQLLFVIIVLSLIALIMPPLALAEFGSLLPVGEAGAAAILRTAYKCSFWFSDYIFLYFVMDNVATKKGGRVFLPVFVAFSIGAILVVLTDVVFVSLYGSYASQNTLAMSKIGIFSVSESTNGRWDWLTMSVWSLSVLLKIIIFVYCAYKCIEFIFDAKFAKVNWVAVAAIASLTAVPMFISVQTLLDSVVEPLQPLFVAVQYLLPLFMPLLVCLTNKKSKEVSACTISRNLL